MTRVGDAAQQMPVAPPGALLANALQVLQTHGALVMNGTRSRGFRSWERKRWIATIVFLGAAALGVVMLALGVWLREIGLWGLLILLGGFLVFAGGTGSIIFFAVSQMNRYRAVAESQPVSIDAHGIWLRGIGPISWYDVAPPCYQRIWTKNDIGGMLAVMPLTEYGHARVNAMPKTQWLLVGPQPYLRFGIPHLLLPGIEGLTEAETMHLFAVAHGMFRR